MAQLATPSSVCGGGCRSGGGGGDGRHVGGDAGEDPLDALTAREREVLALMAEGLSNHGIADRLSVSAPTVEKHVTSIFEKLGLTAGEDDNRRILAVLEYLRPDTP